MKPHGTNPGQRPHTHQQPKPAHIKADAPNPPYTPTYKQKKPGHQRYRPGPARLGQQLKIIVMSMAIPDPFSTGIKIHRLHHLIVSQAHTRRMIRDHVPARLPDRHSPNRPALKLKKPLHDMVKPDPAAVNDHQSHQGQKGYAYAPLKPSACQPENPHQDGHSHKGPQDAGPGLRKKESYHHKGHNQKHQELRVEPILGEHGFNSPTLCQCTLGQGHPQGHRPQHLHKTGKIIPVDVRAAGVPRACKVCGHP